MTFATGSTEANVMYEAGKASQSNRQQPDLKALSGAHRPIRLAACPPRPEV